MANHLRRQLRDRVVTILTGLTTTGTRVYASRLYPVATGNLPGLTIYAAEETADIASLSTPRRSQRELHLIVEGRAAANSGLDNTLDTIATEVEKALAADPTLNGLAYDQWLSRTSLELSGDGEQPVGVITLEYTVRYDVAETTPDAAY